MVLFGFNIRRYEMIVSLLLVYATQRTANCVALAILLRTYQLVNDIRACRGNACIRICSVTQRSSRTELHFRHRVPYSFGWIASPATIKRLSQLRELPLDLVASPASQAYVERLFLLCGDLTARKRNNTKVSLCRRVFLKLNRHILH